jgi:uncharacterized protein with GYD domain
MPKYLVRSSYSTEGVKGLLKDGGSKRRQVVEEAAKAVGGKLEAYYFAFGEDDVITIIDFPDNVTAAAASLVVTASGAGRSSVTVLMTPEEVDRTAKIAATATYRAPGK